MEHVKLQGHKGTFYKVAEVEFKDKKYFLFESEQYGEDAPWVGTDADLNIVLEDITNGKVELMDFLRENYGLEKLPKYNRVYSMADQDWFSFAGGVPIDDYKVIKWVNECITRLEENPEKEVTTIASGDTMVVALRYKGDNNISVRVCKGYSSIDIRKVD